MADAYDFYTDMRDEDVYDEGEYHTGNVDIRHDWDESILPGDDKDTTFI